MEETDKPIDNSLKPEKKKKKMRCPICNKKIALMPYTCKCGGNFCVSHIQPELHNCEHVHSTDSKNFWHLDQNFSNAMQKT